MSYKTETETTKVNGASITQAMIIFTDGRKYGAIHENKAVATTLARKAAGL